MLVAEFNFLSSSPVIHISHESLGKGSPGNPIRPVRDYSRLLGLLRAYWGALAPLPWALVAHMSNDKSHLGCCVLHG